jgi:hypothetical protein
MRRVGSFALFLGFLLTPACATAAPTWLAPTTVSAPGEENQPAGIALGPDGTAIVAFQRATCTLSSEREECEGGELMYSARPPGGGFSPPRAIPGDPGTVNLLVDPEIGFDASGNAIAVWDSRAGSIGQVRYSIRPAGGQFGPVQSIQGPESGSDRAASVAVARDGRAVVTFIRSTEGKSEIWYAVRPPGGSFGVPKPMTDDPGAGNINDGPEVRIDDLGGAIAIWSSVATVRYAVLSAGSGEFSSTQTIEKGGSGELAMAPSGAAAVVWTPSGVVEAVRYAFRPPGGNFGTPRSIVEPDNPLTPRVAIAPDGSAVAAWTALVSPNSFVRWSAAPAGGPFGPPVPMRGAPNPAALQDLVGSAQGAALALWLDFTSTPASRKLNASLRPPGGIFGPPVVLPSPAQGADSFSAAAAFDPEGNAAAVWNPLDPITPSPHDLPLLAAGMDGAGPHIALEAPTTVRQGRPANLTLTATDVWSSVASTRIDFGDGGGAPGPTATHSYDPGTYTVVGSATDSSGNPSSLGQTLRVLNVKPGLSGLRVVPKRFAVGPGASRKGVASIRFRLTERASVRVTVKRRERKAGGKRGHRLKTFGKVVFKNRRQGRNRVGFSGRLKGSALPVGRYVLAAVAVDRTKKRSRPRQTAFKVVPRRR